MVKCSLCIAQQLSDAALLVWDSSRGYTVASVVLMLLQASLSVAALVLLKWIIDEIIVGAAASEPANILGPVGIAAPQVS